MNLIFLDIDGVLNMYGSSSRTFMKPYGQHIEPHLVCRLNYICEKVEGLKIVISSSWRSDMDDLKLQLEEQGFKYWDKVIGKTCKPFLKDKNKKPPHDLKTSFYCIYRGEQIQEWLKDFRAKCTREHHKVVKKYLVIDDEIQDICGKTCNTIPKENVFEVDMNEGMLDRDAKKIVEYFKD